MFLFAAVLFVLLTHLQLIGLLMIGGSLVAAVAMFVTRPRPERTPSPAVRQITSIARDDEEQTDHEYPQAA